jgi:hypothetical protein
LWAAGSEFPGGGSSRDHFGKGPGCFHESAAPGFTSTKYRACNSNLSIDKNSSIQASDFATIPTHIAMPIATARTQNPMLAVSHGFFAKLIY